MYRDLEKDLIRWKNQAEHLPILLRGARQVGKSYVVEKFGQEHFADMLIVNFELQPTLSACFETLHPDEILQKLALVTHHHIVPGKTLLFLDEVQDCPNAIRALRYFKEKLPALHVIAAGSLLEFILNEGDFRMPVGRVQSLYLKPLSFKEYLSAIQRDDLRQYIQQISVDQVIPEVIHQTLLQQVQNYYGLGGMPSVLKIFLTSAESAKTAYDFNQYRERQAMLLNSYRQDFGKYAKHTQIKYLQRVFEKAPGMVGDHFKYSKVDPDSRSEYIKSALELLQQAGLIYCIYSTSASGMPLITLMNEKKFKIVFLDVGLMAYASRVDLALWPQDMILLNRGAIAEQFVGQELLAYSPTFEEARLFFWSREKKSSMAEVDYLMTVGANIVPIEVKAAATGQLKSLHLFMQEKNIKLGVRISQHSLSFDGQILSIPLYMVGEIARLVESL